MELTIKDLCKTYPNGVKAIDSLNLRIGKGMFGLLGPNGAGKSSLMRTIATIQDPDSGSILFGEIDILKDPMSLRRILGYLPQDFGVYSKMNADELLDYFAVLKGVASKTERRKIVEYVLELTNLTDDRKKYVSSYSGGMKQRFGIAQLLLNDPMLIIVDEPTAGLDPAERNRFLNVLREIARSKTIIFSTHIVDDIKDLCNDMAVMNNGRIIKQASPVSAIREIDGKIFVRDVDPNQLKELELTHNILSSKYNTDNSLKIRIHADSKPSGEFEYTFPDLEDVYFIALQNKNKFQS
ncbi:MAG TPA: ABC transporter ATP-binding protein [Ignavibacteria bacterium]|nr:ABC transporter ATP-binding protein [Ignavibacteria bacterium]HMR39333.1 ABC transporter ATP-binding protein [Ignavibacteria bacterium]